MDKIFSYTAVIIKNVCMLFIAVNIIWPHASFAQEIDVTNARSTDVVSPHGVSYLMGSFVYDVPLFEIGYGEWPSKITASLHYDSSSQVDNKTGWSFSTNSGNAGIVTYAEYDETTQYDECNCAPIYKNWQYGAFLSIGGNLSLFEIKNANLDLEKFEPSTFNGSTLTWVSDQPGGYNANAGSDSPGTFTLTERSGNVLKLGALINNGVLKFLSDSQISTRNGFHVNEHIPFPEVTNASHSDTSAGFMIFREPASQGIQRICAYNLVYVDKSTIIDCSKSNVIATITYNQGGELSSVTLPDGRRYTFGYTRYSGIRGYNYNDMGSITSPIGRDHLTCVTTPGNLGCTIANTYDACDGYRGWDGANAYDDATWNGSRDRVIKQVLADGTSETFSYSDPKVAGDPCRDVQSVSLTRQSSIYAFEISRAGNEPVNRTYFIKNAGHVSSVTDPLGRRSEFVWGGANANASYLKRDDLLEQITNPDGSIVQYTYDGRGNVTSMRMKAKPGSGLSDLVTTATFPSSCSNIKTCNRPNAVTDAAGHVTNYEYDGATGLVTKVTEPAVNGVRPQMRYHYQQLYGWFKSGNGYARTDSPVWLLASEEYCRTSSADANGNCAAGTADKVVKSYQYQQGNASHGSNLLLTGTATTANGQTLRTCYVYDELGNRISETSPRAGLATCS
ncbi:YD repeat-containing protein [Stakelama sediminis]|uniref:YD repeat-containing protein n=2 Tax=Stakelama sediminis TaxID=463200 RepID=A0A840Z3K3_9SPHN|nr:YD repeat-containing protein [Stakelama sediminis]